MYEKLLKPIFFLFDPEKVHDFFIWFGELLGRFAPCRRLIRWSCNYSHPSLHARVVGMDFKNPVGLAAGFDKDIRLTRIIPCVGFGLMEVGAVTHFSYGGNQGMRVARLPKDKSILVYYGLKNIGAEAVEQKLKNLTFDIPVGINIAKTNRADIKGPRSIEDYAATYRMLSKYFAYSTINVSCPNTQDGCSFQEPALLHDLLERLSSEKKHNPLFLKISSDRSVKEVDDILAVVDKQRFVDGFIVGNLAKRREMLHMNSSPEELSRIPNAGISGQPIRALSTNLIRHIYRKTNGRYTIIGLGGVFTSEDAYEKIKAGASLIQLITSLIYQGPLVVKKINKGLVNLLAQDGYAHISDAVGKENHIDNNRI